MEKVKILCGGYGHHPDNTKRIRTVYAGDTVTVSDHEADRLVRIGAAELVQDSPCLPVATVVKAEVGPGVCYDMPQEEAPLEPQEEGDSAPGDDVTDGGVSDAVSIDAFGDIEFSTAVDVVDGHFVEDSLMNLTQRELLALADDLGLATYKRMSKKELAAKISGVPMYDDEAVSDGEAPPDLSVEVPVV